MRSMKPIERELKMKQLVKDFYKADRKFANAVAISAYLYRKLPDLRFSEKENDRDEFEEIETILRCANADRKESCYEYQKAYNALAKKIGVGKMYKIVESWRIRNKPFENKLQERMKHIAHCEALNAAWEELDLFDEQS